jgi:hypothetical protein
MDENPKTLPTDAEAAKVKAQREREYDTLSPGAAAERYMRELKAQGLIAENAESVDVDEMFRNIIVPDAEAAKASLVEIKELITEIQTLTKTDSSRPEDITPLFRTLKEKIKVATAFFEKNAQELARLNIKVDSIQGWIDARTK